MAARRIGFGDEGAKGRADGARRAATMGAAEPRRSFWRGAARRARGAARAAGGVWAIWGAVAALVFLSKATGVLLIAAVITAVSFSEEVAGLALAHREALSGGAVVFASTVGLGGLWFLVGVVPAAFGALSDRTLRVWLTGVVLAVVVAAASLAALMAPDFADEPLKIDWTPGAVAVAAALGVAGLVVWRFLVRRFARLFT